MRHGIRWMLAFVFPVIFVACASGGSTSAAASRNQDVIGLAEIQASEAPTALDLIQELRPRWLIQNRGQRSFGEGAQDAPQVILDDIPQPSLDSLGEIPRDAIQEIRMISPRDATFQYGTGFPAGIIKVTTKH